MADQLDTRGAALWNDGEPVNLRAAAMDALNWLDVLAKQAAYIRMPSEDVRRLLACRHALSRQLRRPAGVKGMLNPYPAGDIRADGWQRGYDGRPMMDMAYYTSYYADAHREGVKARAAGVPEAFKWCPECRSAGVVGIEQDVCPTCDGTGKVAAGVEGRKP